MKSKRFLSLLLVLCLCLALLPTAALAADRSYEGKTVVVYSGNVRGNTDIFAQMAAVKKAYAAKGADVVLVDAGNFLQGTTASVYDSGKSILGIMAAAGYDAVALGAYDLVFGDGFYGTKWHQDKSDDGSIGDFLVATPTVKAVSANLTGTNDTLVPNSYSASTVIPRGERKVGIFGITSPEAADIVYADYMSGLQIGAANAADVAAALSDCDVVVGLSNGGDIACEAADAMICIDTTPAADAAIYGAVVIDNETGAVKKETVTLGEADAAVAALAAELKTNAAAKFGDQTANSNVTLNGNTAIVRSGEAPLGDLVTDALLWFVNSGKINNYWSSDDIQAGTNKVRSDVAGVVSMFNGGNLRNTIHTGATTEKDLFRVIPYPNDVSIVYLTGRQIAEQLEACSFGLPYTAETMSTCAGFMQVAGMSYTVDTTKSADKGDPVGSAWNKANSVNRVCDVTVNGAALVDDAVYAVVTHDKNVKGMDACYVMKDAYANGDFSVTTMSVKNVVVLYVREALGGTIGSSYTASAGRIKIKPEPVHTHAYTTVVTPPTCTEKGYTTYRCSCGDNYVDDYKDALGHDYQNGVCSRCGAVSNPYTDVKENDWFYQPVMYCYAKQLMLGTGGQLFAPRMQLTRAMMISLIYRLEGEPSAAADNPFQDVPEGTWYTEAVKWAAQNKIVYGTSDVTFAPNTSITREQMVVMLHQYAQYKGLDVSAAGDLSKFADSSNISAWAKDAVIWATGSGILTGTGNGMLLPRGSATRAEVASLFTEFAQSILEAA